MVIGAATVNVRRVPDGRFIRGPLATTKRAASACCAAAPLGLAAAAAIARSMAVLLAAICRSSATFDEPGVKTTRTPPMVTGTPSDLYCANAKRNASDRDHFGAR
jgi:hypothetical protein